MSCNAITGPQNFPCGYSLITALNKQIFHYFIAPDTISKIHLILFGVDGQHFSAAAIVNVLRRQGITSMQGASLLAISASGQRLPATPQPTRGPTTGAMQGRIQETTLREGATSTCPTIGAGY